MGSPGLKKVGPQKSRPETSLHPVVGFDRFYRTVSQNIVRSANRPALLFILGPLVETEPAENLTFVMEPEKKIKNFHVIHCVHFSLSTYIVLQ